MNSTQQKFNEGDPNFNEWFGKLLIIAGKLELEVACDLYSFKEAYIEGMTPQAAWNDYNEWINS